MTYAESKRKLDEIRNYDEVMFRMAISHLMDAKVGQIIAPAHIKAEGLVLCRKGKVTSAVGKDHRVVFVYLLLAQTVASAFDSVVFTVRTGKAAVLEGSPGYLLISVKCDLIVLDRLTVIGRKYKSRMPAEHMGKRLARLVFNIYAKKNTLVLKLVGSSKGKVKGIYLLGLFI